MARGEDGPPAAPVLQADAFESVLVEAALNLARERRQTLEPKTTKRKSINKGDDEAEGNTTAYDTDASTVANFNGGAPVASPSTRMRARTLEDESANPAEGIDAKNLKRTLQQIERGHSVCCHVFFSILATILFVVVVVSHIDPAQTFQVESTMRQEYLEAQFDTDHKTFGDILVISDFWLWMKEVVVPTSFVQYDSSGVHLDTFQWSRIATYNKLVAGVRLRQTRASGSPCVVPTLDALYGESECFPRSSALSTADFGLPACEALPSPGPCYNQSLFAHIVNGSNNEGFTLRAGQTEFELFLDKYDAVEITALTVDYAEARMWLDEATRDASVEVVTYNGEIGLYNLLRASLAFQRGGNIVLNYDISSAFAEPYPADSWYLIVLDCLFALTVLYKLVSECCELWPYIRTRNIAGYWSNEDGLWNLVDWTAIVLSLFLIGYWLQYVVSIQQVTNDFEAAGSQETSIARAVLKDRTYLFSAEYQEYLRAVHSAADHLQSAVEARSTVLYLAAFNSFMVILRFFKVARFLPRANLLVTTVRIALVDLVHYAAVFLFVLMAFAIEAWLVFGLRIEDFGSLWAATQTSLLIVMGAVDTTALYKEMYEIGPIITVTWYWSFFFVMILLVMNLLIAILIDAYAAARGSLKNRDTLWGEIVHMWRLLTVYWRSGYLRPKEILKCFEPGGSLHGCDWITAELLVKRVEAPGSFHGLWKRATGGGSGGRRRSGGGGGGGGGGALCRWCGGSCCGVARLCGASEDGARSFDDPTNTRRAYSAPTHTVRQMSRPRKHMFSEADRNGFILPAPAPPPLVCEAAAASAAAAAPAAVAAPVVPHLDRLYAEFLIADAMEDKVESAEAHGLSLSDAAKEIADALIRVKIMSDRLLDVEDMQAEILSKLEGPSGRSFVHRARREAVPEPPLTRRAQGRIASVRSMLRESQRSLGAVNITEPP